MVIQYITNGSSRRLKFFKLLWFSMLGLATLDREPCLQYPIRSLTALVAMEFAGLAISVAGLAGLLGTCIDAVNRVDTYRKFGFKSRYITAQFAADKFLLHKWAEAVGITNGRLQDVHHRDLDRDEVVIAIARTLSNIREIFSAVNSFSSNLYGLSLDNKSTFPIDPDDYTNDHSTEEKESRILVSKASKLKWSLGGKARFKTQIEAFGVLVGKLYNIIPLEENNEALDFNIVRTLDELNSSLRGILLCLLFNARANSRQIFQKRNRPGSAKVNAAFKSCLIGSNVRHAKLRISIFD